MSIGGRWIFVDLQAGLQAKRGGDGQNAAGVFFGLLF
jgi:hypothetical protein